MSLFALNSLITLPYGYDIDMLNYINQMFLIGTIDRTFILGRVINY